MFNYKTRENARGAQDKITKELWEHINSMYHLSKIRLYLKTWNPEAMVILTKLNKDFLLYNVCLCHYAKRFRAGLFLE
jgi:hypothetical protein